jgi:F-type H+-transporting ATPase subunit delta
MADDLVQGYAAALFKVVEAEGELDRVEDELFHFGKLLETENQLKQALSDKGASRSERVRVLEEILEGKVSPHTLGLLTFVVAQDRARQLPQILDSLSKMVADARGSVLAEVRSAVPLEEDQRAELARALSSATGKNVSVKVLVDPSVLGGIYAKVGDTVIDGSVRRRLEQVKQQVVGG